MPSTFPGAIDSFTDPLSNSPLNSPSHSTLHSDINDAVEKVEQYMGLVKVIPTAATNGTINATTGTVTIGNAVSSVSVTCFSALYDNYKIVLSGGTCSTATLLRLTLGAASGQYYSSFLYANYATSTPLADCQQNTANFLYGGNGNTTGGLSCDLTLIGPNLAKWTYFTSAIPIGTGAYAGTANGVLADLTQHTAFTLTANSGTLTGGTIRVYGYRN